RAQLPVLRPGQALGFSFGTSSTARVPPPPRLPPWHAARRASQGGPPMTETTPSFPGPDGQPRPLPPRVTLEGRHVRLEPLDIDRHGEDLFLASRDGGE